MSRSGILKYLNMLCWRILLVYPVVQDVQYKILYDWFYAMYDVVGLICTYIGLLILELE